MPENAENTVCFPVSTGTRNDLNDYLPGILLSENNSGYRNAS